MNKYIILPFRHTQFSDSSMLIVNEAGEYFFLSNQDCKKFVEYNLDKTEHLFLDLKSKHFLTDTNIEQPIKLLATKYRTKKGFLRDFTSLHMMVITLRCNHKCKYCQVSSESTDAHRFDMSETTAKKVIETIFRSPSKNIKIEFQGGEPLINWKTIEYTVTYAEKLNKFENRNLHFVICTNLISIDEKELEFIKKHKINISTSLDGPRFIHDENRILRTEGGSYDLFLEKFELSKKIIGQEKISALMTTTKSSLSHMRDIIDEYLRLNMSGIFIRQLNPYGRAEKDSENLDYKTEEFLEAYFGALDYIIDLNLKGYWFVEYYASLILSRILTPFSTGFVDLQSPSGAGISGAIYDYDGSVYPADEGRMLSRMGDKRFLMGNVFSDDYIDIFNGKIINEIVRNSCTEILPSCYSCAFQIYCGADPIRNYVEQGDIVGHRPTSNFCRKNKNIIKWLLEKIKEDNEKVLDVFWSWVTNSPIKRQCYEAT